MIVLGIDPGLSITGFAVMQKKNGTLYVKECGYLKLSPAKTLSQRVRIFNDHFNALITTHAITDIALETPFLGKNAQNFLKLGYLRGILYLLADQHSLILHEFAPRKIKQAVTGWGNATKEQVACLVLKLFPQIPTPKYHDVTDALAITLSALWISNSPLGRLK